MDSEKASSSTEINRHIYADYTGQLKNGRMQGHGTYIFPNGTKYVGEWNDGQFHGKG